MTGISPHYIKLTHRFIANVGNMSLANISKDTGISRAELEAFDKTKQLEPEKVMKLWCALFPNQSFLQAASFMDSEGFTRP